MPVNNYGRFAHTVDRMITKYGYHEESDKGRLFLRRNNVDRECRGAEIEFNPREVDGQIIQRTDRRFILSTKTANGPLDPAPDDESDTLVIIENFESDESTEVELLIPHRPKRLAPMGVVLFWDLQVRSK